MKFNELVELMKKCKAPNQIMHKGIIYNFVGSCTPNEIKEYGLWNNGGYCSENNDFLLDNLDFNNYNSSEIIVLENYKKENKKIEKLKLNYEPIKHTEFPLFKEEILTYCDNLQYKTNEIIEVINNEINN